MDNTLQIDRRQDPIVAQIQLRLLQQPSLCIGRQEPMALAPKDAALLALLVVEGPCTRARLASWLWPHTDPAQARANLRQRLLRLRRLTGREVLVGDHILSLARAIHHDLDDAVSRLRADPHAMQGELLGALDFPHCEELEVWLTQARAQWRARCHTTLEAAAEALLRAGLPSEALPFAQRLVREEPLHEHHHQNLIRIYLQRGDWSAAKATYDQFAVLLKRELDVPPSEATRALVNADRLPDLSQPTA